MLGVVAAEVVVADEGVLARVNAFAEVWLVDLSLEQIGRSRPELADVVMNDLYWRLAGWDH
jgi:hypothetical protein